MSELNSPPGSGISILPATWRDLMAVHQLEKTCFHIDAWPLLDILGVLTIPQIVRVKAQEEENLIGFIAADLRRAQATAWIATLAVFPSFRRSQTWFCCRPSPRRGDLQEFVWECFLRIPTWWDISPG